MRNKGFLNIYYNELENMQFDYAFNFFESRGITLQNPQSGKIHIINYQNSIVIPSYKDIQYYFDKDNTVSTQFWIDAGTDLFTTYSVINKCVMESYSMDGFSDEDMDFINPIIWDYILYLKKIKKLLGFVYDMKGSTEDEFEWNDIFTRRLSLPPIIFSNCIIGYFKE